MTGRSDNRIRRITIGCVGLLALIAGTVSYLHMHLRAAPGIQLVEWPPAYQCRHGNTSATPAGPGRAKNTYIREDQVVPHLATLAIFLATNTLAALQARPARSPVRPGPRN